MFNIPDYPNRRKNSQRCKGEEQPCIICGRPVKNPVNMIHLHNGGSSVVTEEEAATLPECSDMGSYPVGPECLRNHPELRSYVER